MSTTIKDRKQAEKAEKMLNRRVENALPWDEFAAAIPTLHIIDNLHGKNQDGLAMNLDTKHKVAVHEFADGHQVTVPVLRSENYKELAHDYVYDTMHKILDGAGLDHKVLSNRMIRSSGELHADICLNKAYKMDEKGFESDMGVKYTDADDNNFGLYRPLIRVRSSFIRSSEVQMGILRTVCSNGLIGIELGQISVPLRFTHIGNVVSEFEQGVDQLITGLFEKNIIERLMLRLDADYLTCQTVIEWMIQYLGQQATVASVEQFHLEEKQADALITKWVVYNMASWAMSNIIESVQRRNRATRALSGLINS